MTMPAPRDVIAGWFTGDEQPYNHADSIIGKLWKAGYQISRSRFPMAGVDNPSATLFLALDFPGVNAATADADEFADGIALAVNEALAADSGRICVSGIPSPQWLTPETLANLRQPARPHEGDSMTMYAGDEFYDDEVTSGPLWYDDEDVVSILDDMRDDDDPSWSTTPAVVHPEDGTPAIIVTHFADGRFEITREGQMS
jgi:hypothetical protein